MITFKPTLLPSVVMVDPEPVIDARGRFGRTYCLREFRDAGLAFTPVQSSSSFNLRRGTLRGLHYQATPHAEAKLVRCTMGAAFDVAVDVRPRSPTFGRWVGVELSASNRRGLFIPEGFAHGFQTLVDDTELLYLMSDFYDPESQRGVRWDDPAIGVKWPPAAERVVSRRDQTLPYLSCET
ncbi:MAG: dTDP-4-dehydrorhamnose 3,5-epimerase [Acidimicrobiales bacterium]